MSPLILIAIGVIGLYLLLRWRKGVPTGWRRYDTDGDGVISDSEALRALEDFYSGVITWEELQEVMAHRGG